MEKMVLRIMIIISLATFLSCGSGNAGTPAQEQEKFVMDTIEASVLGVIDGNRIIIDKDVDLKGCECRIPKGKSLVFMGGIIKNGILCGNMTKIECKGKAFNRVTIKGGWDVHEISTKLFADLSYENSLRDVVALAHPKVQNRIVIEKGVYKVRAEKDKDVCVPIYSNTDVVINGTIQLAPNDYKSYNIIQVKGKDINVKGYGTIIGDKHTHTGKEGEWGMGINLRGAINTTVKGLTIKDCWGDCIYVGGKSRNVLIEKCHLDHGRRQGISVTKADDVIIRNCTITNVSGTNPQYAIDIEPNRLDSVDNILIENVVVKDCEGGFLVYRGKQKDGVTTPWIGRVSINNCKISCKSKTPTCIKRCEEVKIEKCTLYAQKGKPAIAVTETGKAVIQNNKANIGGNSVGNTKSRLKRLVGKETSPIDVKLTKQSIVKNNIIVER